uniref:ADP-ribosylation factor-like protein 6-interacting protein 6 n=1 Tax=Anopheles merus TaxID=30066 RepID=A0A182V9D2_ANOME
MSSSIHVESAAQNHNNGTAVVGGGIMPVGAEKWYGNGTKGMADVQPHQRPRRLSFNGSDMELSDLKGVQGAPSDREKNAIDTKQTLILLAVATTLAVSIKYLLPSFDLESYRSICSRVVTVVDNVWQDFLDRCTRVRLPTFSWKMENLLQQAGTVSHTLYAVAFGLLLSSFTWYIIYLDSSIPGVNPPTPFSASKKRYRGGPPSKERRFHLPYITALLSGVVGFLIVLLVNE